MTIGQLIQRLSEYHSDLPVCVLHDLTDDVVEIGRFDNELILATNKDYITSASKTHAVWNIGDVVVLPK